MDEARVIHSRLERLSIAEVERDRAALEERFLDAAERAELQGRRAQSVAGFLALKRALAQLVAGLPGAGAPTERDFLLTHHPNGALRCTLSAELLRRLGTPPRLHLSVSHTRDWAYGLAVREEAGHG